MSSLCLKPQPLQDCLSVRPVAFGRHFPPYLLQQHVNVQFRPYGRAFWMILAPRQRATSELVLSPRYETLGGSHPTPLYCPTSKRTLRLPINALSAPVVVA